MSAGDKNVQAMLALIRTALWGENRYPFQPDAEVDWNSVYEELRWQTLEVLPVDMISQSIPELADQSVHSAAAGVKWWYIQMQEQQEMCDLLRKNHIPFVILKGAAVGVYYPQPVYRTMGDIDLIVQPSDFDRALESMVENGYTVENLHNKRHEALERNGVCFELHHYFAVLNRPECQNLFDRLIFEGIEQARMEQIEEFSFPVLPVLENGLVLLEHIGQHLENGLGLRQFIDWMLYSDRELSDDWYRENFQPVVRQLGLETLAVTATRMCQIYLGLREDITWCADAETDLCGELMELVLKQGNFGKREIDNAITISHLYHFLNVKEGFQTLQRNGCINWKTVHVHPWLKPFAWMYQILRLIRKGLSLEHPFRTLAHNIRESRRQNRLMDRLGVTRRGRGVAGSFGKSILCFL